MKFTLPGQLHGPETRVVASQAVKLRRRLEPLIEKLGDQHFRELSIVLRVDGSLGSFGEEGVENIDTVDQTLTCDLVLSDKDWENRSEEWIYDLLRVRVLDAIQECLVWGKIDHNIESLRAIASDAT